MTEPDSDVSSRRGAGLLASLQRMLATLLAIAQTRVEIVATEFEEERARIKELVLYGVFALVFISLGAIALTVFVTLWLWESYGVHALGAVGLLFLSTGVAIGLAARAKERARPRLFATTLAELAKDQRALRGDDE
jgi:uncharacterized membrane protein YqjE